MNVKVASHKPTRYSTWQCYVCRIFSVSSSSQVTMFYQRTIGGSSDVFQCKHVHFQRSESWHSIYGVSGPKNPIQPNCRLSRYAAGIAEHQNPSTSRYPQKIRFHLKFISHDSGLTGSVGLGLTCQHVSFDFEKLLTFLYYMNNRYHIWWTSCVSKL